LASDIFAQLDRYGVVTRGSVLTENAEGGFGAAYRALSSLEEAGHCFEWADIKQDLKALQEVIIQENDTSLALSTPCAGGCGKIFQAVGVAIPPTIREV
jgi:hypothetical protein